MNNVHLSKSKYCNCVQCEKMFWLSKYKPECARPEDKETIFENGRKVGELAKGLFGEYEDIEFDLNLSNMIEKTNQLLPNKPNIITEASFSYDNNFCSVDILKNDLDGVEIYEVKSSTSIKDIYLDDAAYQYYVLSNLGLNVKKVFIVYVNNEYVLDGEFDINEYFVIEDVSDIALQKQDEIRYRIQFINEYMEKYGADNEPPKELSIDCFKPYGCDFWQYCSRNLPSPNIFDIRGMYNSTKFKKYAAGKVSFEDLISERLSPKYKEQVDFELNDRPAKIEREVIRDFLDSLKYPLYFIDYESFQCAIPEYQLTKPYQQIPFQYSLHIIREEGAPIEHKEFLGDIDDEKIIRNFAESMISDLDEDGSVIVYNQVFEKSAVNKKLAIMFPDLSDEIERINSNIVDIMDIFKNRHYYNKEMKGSYSIKYVLPALYPNDPDLDYSNLDEVHNGGEASKTFLSLKGKSAEDQEKTRNNLLEYCKLDTWAMVKLWEKFREVVR